MGRIVIACYRPKAGSETDLIELTRTHVARLRAERLVTDREPIAMVAEDGTVLEVFEWASRKAIEDAHTNPRVREMWEEFAEACDYVPVGEVPEGKQLFSEFAPLEVESPAP